MIIKEGFLMQERSFGKKFLGKWNTVTLVSVAVGAALFGVLMVFGSIPIFTNTFLTSAMIIPVIVGGLFGPIPAFATMLIGNFVADLIGGWGFWFDWSVGNGVLGLFIGALPLYGAKIDEGIFKVQHAIIYAVCCIVGNAIAFGIVTPVMTSIFYQADLEITFIQAFAGGVANTAVLIIIGIPLLILVTARYKKRTDLKEED
jgi:energy-coupling factor transport system substrate-specific component